MYPLLFGLILLLSNSCTATGTVALKDLPEDWPPLGTTKAEVRARLGQPSSQSESIERDLPVEFWIYDYREDETHPVLSVVGGIAAAATGQGKTGEAKTLAIKFDQEGKVTGRSESSQKIGTSPAAPTDQYIR